MKKSFLESLDRPVLEIHPVSNGNGTGKAHTDWKAVYSGLAKVEAQLLRIRFLVELSAPANRAPELHMARDKAVQLCSMYFHVPLRQIRSRLRTDRVALARHVAIHLTHLVTAASLHELGHAFNCDHGTVHHAKVNVRNRCLDSNMLASVQHLETKMRAIFNVT